MGSRTVFKNKEDRFKEYQDRELCRFITCGSVDDGKSTLIGRLLYDTQSVFEDQLSETRKNNTLPEGGIDFSLLLDGLESEREQGITIDVAYRFFHSKQRKFIIADTPGHEQYTRNMATGASTADMSVILIDARKGVLTQTKRHSYITALMGIRDMIVVVNKMDLIDFSEKRFDEIVKEYQDIIPHLPNHNHIEFKYIPLSALHGDNLITLSPRCSWYQGQSFLELLNTLSLKKTTVEHFRFPIQYVNRPHQNFRGYCGTIASGHISTEDAITVLPSGKISRIKSIIPSSIQKLKPLATEEKPETLSSAFAPMAVTLVLEEEVDIVRGDMIVKNDDLPMTSDTLAAMMVWMGETPLSLNKGYIIKRATTVMGGSFKGIPYKKDINTFAELPADQLQLNEIGKVVLKLDRKIAVDQYGRNRYTGGFIVIDRYSGETVGAGMITEQVANVESGPRGYTDTEIALNHYIRQHFPEWQCREI